MSRTPCQQLAEGGVAGQVGPQHHGIDEEPDEALDLGAPRLATGVPAVMSAPAARRRPRTSWKAASKVM
ncbi:hypothetical protein SANTM175S_10361 [Streptomyces antimycoticus]